MADVPSDLLEFRRHNGVDRWNEVWDKVLQVPPISNRAHQELAYASENWLRNHWAAAHDGKDLTAPGG